MNHYRKHNPTRATIETVSPPSPHRHRKTSIRSRLICPGATFARPVASIVVIDGPAAMVHAPGGDLSDSGHLVQRQHPDRTERPCSVFTTGCFITSHLVAFVKEKRDIIGGFKTFPPPIQKGGVSWVDFTCRAEGNREKAFPFASCCCHQGHRPETIILLSARRHRFDDSLRCKNIPQRVEGRKR